MTQYEDRLFQWNQVRNDNATNNLKTALLAVNDWWQLLPIDNPYLHWEDQENWPDPWDILADGIFCDLTKSIGIVYTLLLIDRSDIENIELVATVEGYHLVFINNGTYVLNYCPGQISHKQNIKLKVNSTIDAAIIKNKIG